jgi:uncharacterized membrane protein YbhN (UPF0104 family)
VSQTGCTSFRRATRTHGRAVRAHRGHGPQPLVPPPAPAVRPRRSGDEDGRRGGARRSPVRQRLGTAALLVALVAALVTSVPGLHGVARAIGQIQPAWVLLAIALELASELSFVVLFRLFFDRLSGRDARWLAWTEAGSGALLPGGGAGGLAIGGWLIHMRGAPVEWIVRRSGGLFFLTSAVNSASIIGAGVALVLGVSGPHDFNRAALPALLAIAATAPVAMLPRFTRSRERVPRVIGGVSAGVREAERTTFTRRPSWRLTGALGYLWFDIAVLWVTLHAVGARPSVPALVLAYTIGYLANALPIPGSVGVLDAGLTGALALYGVSPAHAAAGVLVYHAIALWVPGLGGSYSYLRLRPHLSKPTAADTPAAAQPQVAQLEATLP